MVVGRQIHVPMLQKTPRNGRQVGWIDRHTMCWMSRLLEAITELGSQSYCLALCGSASSLVLEVFECLSQAVRSRKERTWRWAGNKSTQRVLLTRSLEHVQPAIVNLSIVYNLEARTKWLRSRVWISAIAWLPSRRISRIA